MKKGFTLLFASLIVSLILSVALSIVHITLVELTLSSSGRDSQFAFYNADTGLECALYYEYNIADSGGETFFEVAGQGGEDVESIECDGVSPTNNPDVDSGGPTGTTTTRFSIDSSPGKGCFDVTIHKKRRTDNVFATNVFIESRGYSTCDASNPRRVERGLYVRFID